MRRTMLERVSSDVEEEGRTNDVGLFVLNLIPLNPFVARDGSSTVQGTTLYPKSRRLVLRCSREEVWTSPQTRSCSVRLSLSSPLPS